MNRVFAKYNLAACIKGALELQGYDVGPPLAPQTPLSDAARSEIGKILADLKSGTRKTVTRRHAAKA
jgi:4-hydroxy-tetrahydrodipicolinate synthase